METKIIIFYFGENINACNFNEICIISMIIENFLLQSKTFA